MLMSGTQKAANQREIDEYWATPHGQARAAWDRGDTVFQVSIDVLDQAAVIVAMVGSANVEKTVDPNQSLNWIAHIGWRLVSASFVFVEQGQQSRDKFMSSGQNVAVKGKVTGFYVFVRPGD